MRRNFTFLCLLMFYCLLTVPLNAQAFTGEAKNLNYAELNEVFYQYTVFETDASLIEAYLENADKNVNISLDIDGLNTFNYDLVENKLYADNAKVIENTSSGKVVTNLDKSLTYHGLQNNGDHVAFTANENFLMVDGKTYFIEPLYVFVDNAPNNLFVYYEYNNVIPQSGRKCGVTSTSNVEKNDSFIQHKSGDNNSPCVELEMVIAADFSMFQSKGSTVAGVTNYIDGIYNSVQLDYNQFCIDFVVSEYFVHTAGANNNPWAESNAAAPIDAGILLTEFCNWTDNCVAGASFSIDGDLHQLWTDKNIQFNGDAGTVGLAFTPTTLQCGDCSLIEDFTTNFNSIRLTVTHEVGHNFG